MNDREQRIRDRAYAIWQREGHPEGREREHWQQAAREIDGEGTQPGAGGEGDAGAAGEAGEAPAGRASSRKKAGAAGVKKPSGGAGKRVASETSAPAAKEKRAAKDPGARGKTPARPGSKKGDA